MGYNQCFVHAMEQHLDCALPWSRNASKLSCSSFKQFDMYERILKNESALKDVLTRFNCLPLECIERSWKSNSAARVEDLTSPLTRHVAILDPVPSDVDLNSTRLVLGLYLKTKRITVLKHTKLYSFANFVADFGGYFGLLLGGSLLAVLDMVVSFSKRCYKRCRSINLA